MSQEYRSRDTAPDVVDLQHSNQPVGGSSSNLRTGGFLLAAFSTGLLLWGGTYLGQYSGRFDGSEFNEIPGARAAAGPVAAPDPDAALKAKGKVIFNNLCAACHNDDGMGKAGIAPQLVDSDWVKAPGAGRLVRIVLHGVKGPIKVNSTIEVNMSMPPQGEVVKTDEEIASVLTYIRSSWGNKAPAIQPAEVAAVRKEVTGRTEAWDVEELLKIPVDGAGAKPLGPDQLKSALKALPADQLKALLQEVSK